MASLRPSKRAKIERLCQCTGCKTQTFPNFLTREPIRGAMLDPSVWDQHNKLEDTNRASVSTRQQAPTAPRALNTLRSYPGSVGADSILQAIQNAEALALGSPLMFSKPPGNEAVEETEFEYHFDRTTDRYKLEDCLSNKPFFQAQDLLRGLKAAVFSDASSSVGDPATRSQHRQTWEAAVLALSEHFKKECKRHHHLQSELDDAPTSAVVNSDRMFLAWKDRPTAVQIHSLSSLISYYFYGCTERDLKNRALSFRDSLKALGFEAVGLEQPLDRETMVEDFNLKPELETFVMCSSCCALYPQDQSDPSASRWSEDRCCTSTYQAPPTVCNNKLFHKAEIVRTSFPKPNLQYNHQALKSWLARMLSRPDIVSHLEEYADHAYAHGAEMHDIWDSPAFWSFGDGFVQKHPGALKLMFGLGVDGFNPFHNKEAKQKRSCTAIYLVLFNLPPNLRYLPENIYLVGLIPLHPALHTINHFLELVARDFIAAWKGLKFSRTFIHPNGVILYAAIFVVLCDMLAARQVTGFPSATSKGFCMACDLPVQEIHKLDPEEFPPKKWDILHAAADQWEEAISEEERSIVWKSHQIRFSPLNRLSYWNAVRYTVADSMHFDLLGNIQNYLRFVLGIDHDLEGGDGTNVTDIIARPRADELAEAVNKLNTCKSPEIFAEVLEGVNIRVLRTICIDNRISHGGKRAALARSLQDWYEAAAESGLFLIYAELQDASVEVQLAQIDLEDEPEERGSSAQTQPQRSLNDPTEEPRGSPLVSPQPTEVIVQTLPEINADENRTRKKFMDGTASRAALGRVRLPISRSWATEFKVSFDWLPDEGYSPDSRSREVVAWALFRHMEAFLAPATKNASHVLGKSIMEDTHGNEKVSHYPLGLHKPPVRWGTTAHGKLSADQWGVIATKSLIIILVLRWGYPESNDEPEKSQRELDMLHNFTDLVKASLMAHNRVTSTEHGDSYRQHAFRFFQGCQQLYPGFAMRPSNHIGLHYGDTLKCFGPSHAIKVPGFERLNYVLSSINTNQKHGEMETTYLRHHCEAQALVGLINSFSELARSAHGPLQAQAASLSEAGNNVWANFQADNMRSNLGTRIASDNVRLEDHLLGTPHPLQVPPEFVQDFPTLAGNEQDWPKMIWRGQEYNSLAHSRTGCYAIVNIHTASGPMQRVAQIQHIIRRPQTSTEGEAQPVSLLCRLFKVAEDVKDMWLELELGYLISSELEEQFQLLSRNAVHCAPVLSPVCINEKQLFVAIPSDKLLPPFRLIDYEH